MNRASVLTVEGHFAEYYHTDCRGAEYRYAECYGILNETNKTFFWSRTLKLYVSYTILLK